MLSEEKFAEIVVRAMIYHGISPDETFTADAGTECGLVEAWRLPMSGYAVKFGDNAQTNYDIAPDANDLAEWLLEWDDSESQILSLANIRGLDAIDKAEPNNAYGYAVLVSHHYYGPRTEHHFASDNHGVLQYESLDEAQTAADEMDEGLYVTRHNESGRPTYTVVAL